MTLPAPAIWLTLVIAVWACRGGGLKPSRSEHPERHDVRVSDSAVCSRCGLELQVVGTAGADSQAPKLIVSSAIALLDSGQIAVAPVSVDGVLAVYRADGQLARMIP